MMDQLQHELENYGQENKQDEPEAEEEEIDEGEGSSEDEMDDSDDGDSLEPSDNDESEDDGESDIDESDEDSDEADIEEIQKHRGRKKDELTQSQKLRFEKLTERIAKKIVATFGGTCEFEMLYSTDDRGNKVVRGMRVISRGLTFDVDFHGERYDPEEHGEIDNEAA